MAREHEQVRHANPSGGARLRISVSATIHPYSILLRHEGALDRAGKGVGIDRELQTGDPTFDRDVYVETDGQDDDVKRILGPAVREAIRAIVTEKVSLTLGAEPVAAQPGLADACCPRCAPFARSRHGPRRPRRPLPRWSTAGRTRRGPATLRHARATRRFGARCRSHRVVDRVVIPERELDEIARGRSRKPVHLTQTVCFDISYVACDRPHARLCVAADAGHARHGDNRSVSQYTSGWIRVRLYRTSRDALGRTTATEADGARKRRETRKQLSTGARPLL